MRRKRFRAEPRLCETDQETAFVEALLVCVMVERRRGKPLPQLTDNQVKAAAKARTGLDISDRQTFRRLKQNYITRPGKPATRFELLRVADTGRRDRRWPDRPGTPSTYVMSGLNVLLPPELRSTITPEG